MHCAVCASAGVSHAILRGPSIRPWLKPGSLAGLGVDCVGMSTVMEAHPACPGCACRRHVGVPTVRRRPGPGRRRRKAASAAQTVVLASESGPESHNYAQRQTGRGRVDIHRSHGLVIIQAIRAGRTRSTIATRRGARGLMEPTRRSRCPGCVLVGADVSAFAPQRRGGREAKVDALEAPARSGRCPQGARSRWGVARERSAGPRSSGSGP